MRHLYKFSLLLLLMSSVFSQSCDGGGTYVVLKMVEEGPRLAGVTQVVVDLQLAGSPDPPLELGGQITFPTAVTLEIGRGQGMLLVQVRANDQAAKEVGYGSNSGLVVAGVTTELTITLGPSLLEVIPATRALGLVPLADSVETAFQVRNVGEMKTGGLAVALTGEEFVLTANGCIEALLPGGSCTVKVKFQPMTAGNKSGKLKVSGTPGGSVEAALSGTGAGGTG